MFLILLNTNIILLLLSTLDNSLFLIIFKILYVFVFLSGILSLLKLLSLLIFLYLIFKSANLINGWFFKVSNFRFRVLFFCFSFVVFFVYNNYNVIILLFFLFIFFSFIVVKLIVKKKWLSKPSAFILFLYCLSFLLLVTVLTFDLLFLANGWMKFISVRGVLNSFIICIVFKLNYIYFYSVFYLLIVWLLLEINWGSIDWDSICNGDVNFYFFNVKKKKLFFLFIIALSTIVCCHIFYSVFVYHIFFNNLFKGYLINFKELPRNPINFNCFFRLGVPSFKSFIFFFINSLYLYKALSYVILFYWLIFLLINLYLYVFCYDSISSFHIKFIFIVFIVGLVITFLYLLVPIIFNLFEWGSLFKDIISFFSYENIRLLKIKTI